MKKIRYDFFNEKRKKYMVDAWNKGQMKNTFKNGGNDMKEKTYYVIQNKEGKFFTLDDSSGGYPVFVNDFESCEKYDSEKSANNFLNGKYATEQFATEFIGAKVRKVTAMVYYNLVSNVQNLLYEQDSSFDISE